jgi:23S rRNA pseudouridine2605 synthase
VVKKTSSNRAERLNKILAAAGIASRRRADELISQGLVTVNGRKETKLGSQAVWGIDAIAVNGQPIPAPPKKIYLMLNKPFGYVCTLRDPEGRPIVRDLIKGVKERIYPLGRLDFDSMGLLILTNDGELSYRLMHPKYQIPRAYKAIIGGSISNASVEQLKTGILLDDGPTGPARVRVINRQHKRSVVRITIFEGKSREIRRMFEALGHKTLQLIRIGYGGLQLGDLKVGGYRHLKDGEVEALRTAVGLD